MYVHSYEFRSKVAQYENQSLIKIEGVNTTKDAEFYYGKRVAYVYKVGFLLVWMRSGAPLIL